MWKENPILASNVKKEMEIQVGDRDGVWLERVSPHLYLGAEPRLSREWEGHKIYSISTKVLPRRAGVVTSCPSSWPQREEELLKVIGECLEGMAAGKEL